MSVNLEDSRMDQTAKKALFHRLGCAMLALLLVAGLLPAGAEVSHGMVLGDKVLFRKAPDTSDFWDRLNTGWVAEVLDTVTSSGVTWYKVEVNIPISMDRLYTGYIKGDFFRLLTAGEEAAWIAGGKPQPFTGADTTSPQGLSGNYALVIAAGANLRQTAGSSGASIAALPKDQLLLILSGPASGWYRVEAGEYTGYILAEHLRVMTDAEKAAWVGNGITPDTIPNPSGSEDITGTLKITLDSTNMRQTPGGTSFWQYPVGAILSYSGQPVLSGGFYWAKIVDGSRTGYVRSDCYVILTGGGSMQPTAAPQPGTSQGSVRITLGETNLRQNPGGSVLATLSRGVVLPFYGTPTAFGGYNWVYAYDDGSKQYGYVRSDCFSYVSAPPTQTPAPENQAAIGSLTLTKGGVNLRSAPAGLTIAQLDRGLTMNFSSISTVSGFTWYLVASPKGAGWVRSDVVLLNQGSVPTPTPGQTPNPGAMGYIVTIKSGINLRGTASGLSVGQVDKGLVLPLTGPVLTADGFSWFPVVSGGKAGYLRGDCARQLTAAEVTNYLTNGVIPGLTPPTDDGNQATGYIMTLQTSVNVRRSPSLDAGTLGQVANAGEVYPLLSTVDSGGRMWYRILYNAQEAYLLGSTARMMTAQEYADYIANHPTPPPVLTPTPRPEDMSLTAITRVEKVLIRDGAGTDKRVLTTLYKQGTIAILQGGSAQASGYTWLKARAANVTGWIRGDMLRVLTKVEEQLLNQVGDPDAPKTASYRTLSLGSTGEDVMRLQQELNRLGYLQSAYVTGTYNGQTVDAVKAYQQSKGLFMDGIAGSNTQHKLYGTVPEGTYDPDGGSTVNPDLNPVEKSDWFTGDINSFWARGTVAIMTDIKSGISLRIKRKEGGYHVDGEPLSAADTAALARAYGVGSAQEILEKNLYQRRPVWITLKGRTFAASLYGVPHNYPAGDSIPDNNYSGQLCIHFTNSRVHSSNTVDADHMKAIDAAYNAAPSKK
jgi:peptidoglycan hydrolase-like protein with peptidoglycan-binding domain